MLLLVVVFHQSHRKETDTPGWEPSSDVAEKNTVSFGNVTVGLGKLDAAGQVQEQRTVLRDRLDGLATPKILSRGTTYTEVPGYF